MKTLDITFLDAWTDERSSDEECYVSFITLIEIVCSTCRVVTSYVSGNIHKGGVYVAEPTGDTYIWKFEHHEDN